MPSRRRRRRRTRADQDGGLRMYLLTGRFPGDDFRHYVEGAPDVQRDAEAAWQVVGAALTADWVAEHPGSRPFAWWLFQAPELRRERPGRVAALCKQFGWQSVPADFRGPRYGMANPRFPELYETETEYLARLNLLLPGEPPSPRTA